jgi:hypothetical protein
MHPVLLDAAARAHRYLEDLDTRRVAPSAEAVNRLSDLGGPLPEHPSDPEGVLAALDAVGSPATVASAGGRYFGFVVGGALPAALAVKSRPAVVSVNNVYEKPHLAHRLPPRTRAGIPPRILPLGQISLSSGGQ